MAQSKVFRKVALERLSSPEQLDQLMQVTSPRDWLALLAFLALLAVAVVWGVFGSVPTTAGGEGILLRRGGIVELVATGSGQVEEVLVAVGDPVEKGQVVAKVRQEALIRQISDAESRLGAAADELAQLDRYAAAQKRLSARNAEQQRANLRQTIATLERELEILEENLSVQQALLADGLITQQTLLQTEQTLNQTRDQLATRRLDLAAIDLAELETARNLDQRIEERRNRVRDLELELGELRASLVENVNVVAREGGRVVELLVDRGDVVDLGTALLNMEVASEELIAAIYVPADLGKQVQAGMPARVFPSTVKREEYGYLVGEVTRVAEFPSTARGMQRLLANESLVERLMQEGPPIQVEVGLKENPRTPTGYAWSSSQGPALEITSGTLAEGSVILRSDRPVALVLPKIRERLGL